MVKPEAVEAFKISEKIARHLAYFNIEWHIIPSDESVPILNENYGKQLYPMIKREVNPNEYKKTSSYRAILSGHQTASGKNRRHRNDDETEISAGEIISNTARLTATNRAIRSRRISAETNFASGSRYGHNYSDLREICQLTSMTIGNGAV